MQEVVDLLSKQQEQNKLKERYIERLTTLRNAKELDQGFTITQRLNEDEELLEERQVEANFKRTLGSLNSQLDELHLKQQQIEIQMEKELYNAEVREARVQELEREINFRRQLCNQIKEELRRMGKEQTQVSLSASELNLAEVVQS